MGAQRVAGATISRKQWAGFFALCLMSSSAWLVDAEWPSALPVALRQGLHDLVIAAALLAVNWKSGVGSKLRVSARVKLGAASIVLLGAPAAIAQLALRGVSEVTIAASFALLPVAVVVLASYADAAGGRGANRLLAPAVVGLAGMLLLLPFEVPGSWRQTMFEGVILIAVGMAAVGSVWMHRLLRDVAVADAVVVCCFANAVFFFFVCAVSTMAGGAEMGAIWGGASNSWSWKMLGGEAVIALLFDLPQMVLLLWLMREIVPERFAARSLVIPLFTVIEGYVLLRPELTLRAAGGAALVVVGAWRLMVAKPSDGEPRRILG